MKKLLFLFLLLPFIGLSQTFQNDPIWKHNKIQKTDSVIIVPLDTTGSFNGFRIDTFNVTGHGRISLGQLRYVPSNHHLYIWDNIWRDMTSGVGVGFDSSAIKGMFSADPPLVYNFTTGRFFLDTTTTSGGWHSKNYYNATYLEIGKTITINGATQNLKDNPSFTISTGSTSIGNSNTAYQKTGTSGISNIFVPYNILSKSTSSPYITTYNLSKVVSAAIESDYDDGINAWWFRDTLRINGGWGAGVVTTTDTGRYWTEGMVKPAFLAKMPVAGHTFPMMTSEVDGYTYFVLADYLTTTANKKTIIKTTEGRKYDTVCNSCTGFPSRILADYWEDQGIQYYGGGQQDLNPTNPVYNDIIRSLDSGKSWSTWVASAMATNGDSVMRGNARGTVRILGGVWYKITRNIYPAGNSMRCYKSYDKGQTWIRISDPPIIIGSYPAITVWDEKIFIVTGYNGVTNTSYILTLDKNDVWHVEDRYVDFNINDTMTVSHAAMLVNGNDVLYHVMGNVKNNIYKIYRSDIQKSTKMRRMLQIDEALYLGQSIEGKASMLGNWVKPGNSPSTFVRTSSTDLGTLYYQRSDRGHVWISTSATQGVETPTTTDVVMKLDMSNNLIVGQNSFNKGSGYGLQSERKGFIQDSVGGNPLTLSSKHNSYSYLLFDNTSGNQVAVEGDGNGLNLYTNNLGLMPLSVSNTGIAKYNANYHGLFSGHTLIDKDYFDSVIATIGGGGGSSVAGSAGDVQVNISSTFGAVASGKFNYDVSTDRLTVGVGARTASGYTSFSETVGGLATVFGNNVIANASTANLLSRINGSDNWNAITMRYDYGIKIYANRSSSSQSDSDVPSVGISDSTISSRFMLAFLLDRTTPSTPSSGVILYPKSDHHLYALGSDGVERDLSSGATINNDANTRVVTANGDGTLDAETNFTVSNGFALLKRNTGLGCGMKFGNYASIGVITNLGYAIVGTGVSTNDQNNEIVKNSGDAASFTAYEYDNGIRFYTGWSASDGTAVDLSTLTPKAALNLSGQFGIGYTSFVGSEKLRVNGDGIFNGSITTSDDAYDASTWNGNTTVPSKNAVRDEIENVKSLAPKMLWTNRTLFNNSGSSETDLHSFSIPAGKMSNDGDVITGTCVLRKAANTNSVTIKFYFGSTSFTFPAFTESGSIVKITFSIIRDDATNQKLEGEFKRDNGTTQSFTLMDLAPTETMSGAITFKITGQGSSSSDIAQKSTELFYWRAGTLFVP